ncbi:MAG TPA: ISL3 family transposase, partial [Candidatus Methylomirabilis sp.]|nr:ISL3 family transposase [Candidatus Methylomirabilis sp.]
YDRVTYSTAVPDTIEAVVVPRVGSQPRCSGCDRACPTYDHAPQPRAWIMPPLFKFALVLIYTMRRVKCSDCGVLVEQVPWASGKQTLCHGFRLLLARWARKLSWDETADSFKVSWADVYASVQWVVEYGLAHRVLENIQAIGVDEICVRVGRVFWTLIYQIDEPLTRLLWVGHDRTEATLLRGLNSLGAEICAGIRYVCSDMWGPYLAAVKHRLGALHILDRFHIRQQLNKAIDEVRRDEARSLAQAGLKPRLKKLRWALLKNRRNWTRSDRRRMKDLQHSGLAAIRAYWLVAAFEHFWGYASPTWAGKFLDGWCQRIRRSRLMPLKTVANSLTEHREVLLNYFRAKKAISGGVIEGLNNKVKVTFRKSYGFRTDKAREIALFHVLGKLPEPELIHGFF